MNSNVTVEHFFPLMAQGMWNAITNHRQMRQWFFKEIPDFKPEVGFETSFVVDAGERKFDHQWKVDEVIPLKKMVLDWSYGGYTGNSKVTFLLESKGVGTYLTLMHEGVDSFPQDIPEFAIESCEKGWQYFIKERLVKFADKIAH